MKNKKRTLLTKDELEFIRYIDMQSIKYDLTMIIVTRDNILFMFGDLYNLYAEQLTYSRKLLSFKFHKLKYNKRYYVGELGL